MLFQHCRRPRTRYVAAIERLEGRELLAGDLTVNFAAGVLTITGDGSSTNADLGPVGSDLQLVGFEGTTINGSADPFTLVGILSSVEGSLSGGNDIFRIRTTSADTITLDLGDGNDELLLASLTVTSSVQIEGRAGNDTIDVGLCNIGGTLIIDADDGNDFVGLEQLTVQGNTLVSGEVGNDRIMAFRAVCDDISLLGGDGNDAISIVDGTIAGQTLINAGSGNDNVAIGITEFNQIVEIWATPGKDKIMITASSGPNLAINTALPSPKSSRGAVTGNNGTTIVLTATNFTTVNTNPTAPGQNSETTKKDVQKIYKKVFKGSRAKELGGAFGESSEPWYLPQA